MKNAFIFFNKKILSRKWKRYKKKGKTIRIRVDGVLSVLRAMDAAGIRYVVLRWPEDVPVTSEAEALYDKDIDILTDLTKSDTPKLADIALRFSGHIPFDVYNISGQGGMFYKKMPYYPPALAEEILSHRQLYNDLFYIPDPERMFLSLLYHLVYHKGLDSGIPSGCGLVSDSSPKRLYGDKLEQLSKNLGFRISRPVTLVGLYEYLKTRIWSMPYDLLERWPDKSPWHQFLLELEIEQFRLWAEKLPGLLVFFIRECASQPEQVEHILKSLSGKFDILRYEKLNNEQTTRVTRLVRGGNWFHVKRPEKVNPVFIIICYDHRPVKVNLEDVPQARQHPQVKNQNVFIKHTIRENISQMAESSENGIHGSDNEFEAQHMIRAVYDAESDSINRELLLRVIDKKSPINRPDLFK